jgi:hypothetical protein
MHERVKEFLITVYKTVKIMRDGKYHMVIRCIYDLGPAFVHPEFFQDCLTVGTVPVTAGVEVGFSVATFITNAHVAAHVPGLASDDGIGGFHLFHGRMAGCGIAIPGLVKDLLYFSPPHH